MQNIIIPNQKHLEEVKQRMKQQGKNKLHVLADFDRTLTKAFHKNEKTGSIISKLRREKGRYLTEDYAEKAQELFDKYHPIEISHSISQEEKNRKMYEWWKLHKELLIEKGFDKQTAVQCVKNMIKEDTLAFREGVEDFLKFLNKNNIPLIIITSSLGDLITEFLKQKNLLCPNIHIIGNTFKFDKNGKAIGIEKIIHVFSKNEESLENLPVYN